MLVCGSELVPKKRTSYALYLGDQYDSVKQQLGLREERYQREVISGIGKSWKKLTKSEKQVWENKSHKEGELEGRLLRAWLESWQLESGPCW